VKIVYESLMEQLLQAVYTADSSIIHTSSGLCQLLVARLQVNVPLARYDHALMHQLPLSWIHGCCQKQRIGFIVVVLWRNGNSLESGRFISASHSVPSATRRDARCGMRCISGGTGVKNTAVLQVPVFYQLLILYLYVYFAKQGSDMKTKTDRKTE